jgi:solute carrier family 25 citrate transporter 1
MVSGFSAAFVGPIATGPFDVAKTRMMAQEKGAGTQYTGFFNCIARVAREEGPGALYKGLLPRLLRIPPGQAITWAVADQVINAYENAYMR